MLSFFADKLSTLRLQARYQRLIHERLVDLTERSTSEAAVAAEDGGRWELAGTSEGLPSDDLSRRDARSRARQLVTQNPHARNILRLLESYVAGTGLALTHRIRADDGAPSPLDAAMLGTANRLWGAFLELNQCHYSFREHARRAWRDGECFIRKFPGPQWPPALRFVDPESVGAPPNAPQSQGILTQPGDVEQPIAYLLVDPQSGALREQVTADEMLHSRVGVDSNQKRGVTIFTPILDVLDCYDQWMRTELQARKLQSSIVLWRKIQGSPQQAMSLSNAAGDSPDGLRRERFQPGTILTTNQATDIQFLQPHTNFGDAVPLGRMLLLATAAGAGLPEFMLTADASNSNYASTMVAEGPAVKLFQSEQSYFAGEWNRLWRWIMVEAVQLGLLPGNFFDRVVPEWTFPQLVNRDRPRERMADVRLVESRVLSRAEIARREGADPTRMRGEIASEADLLN
ncbi:MAG: phage portal protein [Planctomycetaceae bacterium]